MNGILARLLDLLDAIESPAPPPVPPPAPAPLDPSYRALALSLINAARAEVGKPGLIYQPNLQAVALSHALVMSRAGKLGHLGVGDGDPWERIKLSGYRYAAAGENVAAGPDTAAAVVAAWMRSPLHRATLLGPYLHLGLARAQRPGGPTYWCLVAGAPA